MSLTLVSSVDIPIDLDVVKLAMQVEHSDDDEYITSLLSAAVGIAENYTNRKILKSTYEYKLRNFCSDLVLPVSPIISVDSLEYTDPDGVNQSSAYYLKNRPLKAVLLPVFGEVWPDVQEGYDGVVINFTAGYDEIPEPIKLAIMKIVSTAYKQSDDVSAIKLHEVPASSRSFLDEYKVVHV